MFQLIYLIIDFRVLHFRIFKVLSRSIVAWGEEICHFCSGSFRSEQYWLSVLHDIHIKAKVSKVACEWHLYQQISMDSKYSLLTTFYGFYI